MTKRVLRDVAASVRQRLLNLHRETGEDFGIILSRYAIERLLYRLSQSKYADTFVLKGAMLFAIWTERLHRPTRDLDLLGHGPDSADRLVGVFREIMELEVEADGLVFDAQQIAVSDIREDQEYQGKRVKIESRLGAARIAIQVDIGFGDAVTPSPETVDYPTLLDMPAPRVRAYPREAAVAEKLQTIVVLGMLNSRMKDFYDVLVMSREFAFAGDRLVAAIVGTFGRRRTAFPSGVPEGLSEGFGRDGDKTTQWNAFLRRSRLEAPAVDFAEVVGEITHFLLPPLQAASAGESFVSRWEPGGPWQ